MRHPLVERLHQIVFGTDTRAGKLFDIVLLWLIIASVVVVVLESIPLFQEPYQEVFNTLELFFTILFTFEYLLRLSISPKPMRYATSYLGVIDLLGIIPFYLALMVAGYHYFVVFRLLRMLRVFRILRLFRFVHESDQLFQALRASAYKIVVFISFVFTAVILMGTLMYVVEGPGNGYTSIPQSIYWTIVTITTVGYGDITPQTALGKLIASIIMLCGYAIIAVPTGIVTVEMSRRSPQTDHKTCTQCSQENVPDARFCHRCGNEFAEVFEERHG